MNKLRRLRYIQLLCKSLSSAIDLHRQGFEHPQKINERCILLKEELNKFINENKNER